MRFGTGELQPLVPARLLDTREGNGASVGKVGPGSTTVLQVAGRGGVPAVGAGAVVLNVVATEPTASGYVTVYPTGVGRPLASNLNVSTGQTVPNLVVVKLGQSGTVSLFNLNGNTHLIADVAGWFPESAGIEPMTPTRLLDTRDGTGAPAGAAAEGSTTTLQVAGRAGIPASGVGAVVLNVTVTEPTGTGYVTVFPTGEPQPLSSNLNFTPGLTVPNLVIAKVGAGGAVSLFNSAGHTHLVADVAGWFPASSELHAISPSRFLDTREGNGAPKGAVGAGSVTALQITGRNGLPATGVGAVILNVTVTEPTADGYITVYPSGVDPPTASNLNMRPGQTVPNLVIAKVGAGGVIDLYNSAGTSHLVADVVGWFPDSGPNTTTLTMKAGTVLAGAGDVISYTGSSDTGGTIVLSGSADVPPSGGFLAVAPHAAVPGGLFGKVTGTADNPDGSVTVTFVPALLEEGFKNINVSFHGPAQPRNGGSPSNFRRIQASGCKAADNVAITPTLSFDVGDLTFDFDLADRYMRFELPASVTAAISAEFRGGFSCAFDLYTSVIPLPEGAFLEISPRISVSVSAALKVRASVTESVNLGFVAHGSDVQDLSTRSLTTSGDLSAQASASVTIRGAVRVSFKEFNVVGFYIDLGINIAGTVNPFGIPCVSLTAQATLDFGVSVKQFKLGWDFQVASYQGPKLTILDVRDNCQFGPWVGTISYTGNAGGPGRDGPTGTQDANSAHMTYTLSGQVDDLGRYLATATGTIKYEIWDPALPTAKGLCVRRHRTGTATFSATPGVLVSFYEMAPDVNGQTSPPYVSMVIPETAPVEFKLDGQQYKYPIPDSGNECVDAVETPADFYLWTSALPGGCPALPLPFGYDEFTTTHVLQASDSYSGNPTTAGNGWCGVGQDNFDTATYSLSVTYNLHR